MKRILLASLALGTTMCSFAQTDSTRTGTTIATDSTVRPDTIRVGGLVIVRDGKGEHGSTRSISFGNRRRVSNANLSTNWFVFDLGFSNFDDHTSYASLDQSVLPGAKSDQFKLRNGKSVNVNIWVFMQKLNVVKHVVNLKYGIGLELNNYRFDDERVHFLKSPNRIVLDSAWTGLDKNKLAADYLTVPVMLNFNLTPKRKNGFGFSAGASVGYLYSARQKVKDNGKKDKIHGNFDLDPWKISALAEVQLGPVRLYGSHALNSMWTNGLDQRPYNVGLRFSRW